MEQLQNVFTVDQLGRNWKVSQSLVYGLTLWLAYAHIWALHAYPCLMCVPTVFHCMVQLLSAVGFQSMEYHCTTSLLLVLWIVREVTYTLYTPPSLRLRPVWRHQLLNQGDLETLAEICADLFERVKNPVRDVLRTTEITMVRAQVRSWCMWLPTFHLIGTCGTAHLWPAGQPHMEGKGRPFPSMSTGHLWDGLASQTSSIDV